MARRGSRRAARRDRVVDAVTLVLPPGEVVTAHGLSWVARERGPRIFLRRLQVMLVLTNHRLLAVRHHWGPPDADDIVLTTSFDKLELLRTRRRFPLWRVQLRTDTSKLLFEFRRSSREVREQLIASVGPGSSGASSVNQAS
jgi:hypothetical protein